MAIKRSTNRAKPRGFMGRLRRDIRGNTLAMMAVMLVPMIAFSGSAIDMARLYVVKVRLQQACDAGALAARRNLADTKPGAVDQAAIAQGTSFFENNLPVKWMQTNGASISFTKLDDPGNPGVANIVKGTASVVVPMAMMKFIFHVDDQPLNVTCQSKYDLQDTDVVFVLDISTSMACAPNSGCGDNPTEFKFEDGSWGYNTPEQTNSKLSNVRKAVLDFDTTMRDSAGKAAGGQMQFRYGFVPYSAAVNIGDLIPSAYIDRSGPTYQSRSALGHQDDTIVEATATVAYGTSGNVISKAACETQKHFPAGITGINGYSANVTYTVTGATSPTSPPGPVYLVFGGTPQGVQNASFPYGKCTADIKVYRPTWRYGPVTYSSTGGYPGLGAAYTTYIDSHDPANPRAANPTRADGSLSERWRGCVEEILPGSGNDLNPEYKGSWYPQWPDVEWSRDGTPTELHHDSEFDLTGNAQKINKAWSLRLDSYGNPVDSTGTTTTTASGKKNRWQQLQYACGAKAMRLGSYDHDAISTYLNSHDFTPMGRTYHDAGLLWGLRMLSPNGIWDWSKAATGRLDPKRAIVFLTDGDIFTPPAVYDQYGVELLDHRVTGSTAPTKALNDKAHADRFQQLCVWANRHNINIYVVAYGADVTDLKAMDSCDTRKKADVPDPADPNGLSRIFQDLARSLAKLSLRQ